MLNVNNSDERKDIRTRVHLVNSLTHISPYAVVLLIAISKTVEETPYRNFIRDSVAGDGALIGEKALNNSVNPYNSARSKSGYNHQSLISTISFWFWQVNIPR